MYSFLHRWTKFPQEYLFYDRLDSQLPIYPSVFNLYYNCFRKFYSFYSENQDCSKERQNGTIHVAICDLYFTLLVFYWNFPSLTFRLTNRWGPDFLFVSPSRREWGWVDFFHYTTFGLQRVEGCIVVFRRVHPRKEGTYLFLKMGVLVRSGRPGWGRGRHV